MENCNIDINKPKFGNRVIEHIMIITTLDIAQKDRLILILLSYGVTEISKDIFCEYCNQEVSVEIIDKMLPYVPNKHELSDILKWVSSNNKWMNIIDYLLDNLDIKITKEILGHIIKNNNLEIIVYLLDHGMITSENLFIAYLENISLLNGNHFINVLKKINETHIYYHSLIKTYSPSE